MQARKRLPSSGTADANRPSMTWKTVYHFAYSCLCRFHLTFQAPHWCLLVWFGSCSLPDPWWWYRCCNSLCQYELEQGWVPLPSTKVGVSHPEVGGSWKIPRILVWVEHWCVHGQQSPDLCAYNSQAGCSQSLLGGQLGKLLFPVVLLSWKDKHRCRCLIKGVLARMHAWQLRYSSQGHSCSSASCVGGCPQKPCMYHWGLQLGSACSGCSPGQSVGCLYDLRGLASSSASGSYSESGNL